MNERKQTVNFKDLDQSQLVDMLLDLQSLVDGNFLYEDDITQVTGLNDQAPKILASVNLLKSLKF